MSEPMNENCLDIPKLGHDPCARCGRDIRECHDSPCTTAVIHPPLTVYSLRDIRRAQNLTQEAVCDAAGYKRGWVSSLEQGHCVPSVRSLKSYAAGMGMVLTVSFTNEDGDDYELDV